MTHPTPSSESAATLCDTPHTPGPWETTNGTDVFGPLGGDSGDGMRADESDGWQVAACNVGITFCGREQMELGYGVRLANARLIAAAPDLLRELQHAVRWFDQINADDVARYRAAIAKATGAA